MAGAVPGPKCRYRQPTDLNDGTSCRAESPHARPLGAVGDSVRFWTTQEKLLEAARRAAPRLPAEIRSHFLALFTGTNLAITAGVLAAWGASHWIGVGEVVDVGLLIVGVAAVGWQALEAGRDLGRYLKIARDARSLADLDRAAAHLARAVIALGIVTFIALILKAGGRAKAAAPALQTEGAIVTEARAILASPLFKQIRAAQAAGKSVTVKIGQRSLQYEPGMPASGMTMFGENGFVIGREAFKSEAELVKTLLHELYRLHTSGIGKGALPAAATSMQEVVQAETTAAAAFADTAFAKFFSGQK